MRNWDRERIGLISEWNIIGEKTPNTETLIFFILKVYFYFMDQNNEQEGEWKQASLLWTR